MKKINLILIISFSMIFLTMFVYASQLFYQVNSGVQLNINEHGTCFKVKNNNAQSMFVPTNTQAEWTAFINNAQGINLGDCVILEGLIFDMSMGNYMSGNYYIENVFSRNAINLGGILVANRFNEANKASYFNHNDFAEFFWGNGLPTNSFSFSLWIKAQETHDLCIESTQGTAGTVGQKYVLQANHGGDFDAGMGLSVGTNGICVFEHGSNYMPALAVYNQNIGTQWNHITIVYNQKRPQIYLNGQLVRTGLQSPRNSVYPSSMIGNGVYGGFKGTVSDVLFYNRALSSSEVMHNYLASK